MDDDILDFLPQHSKKGNELRNKDRDSGGGTKGGGVQGAPPPKTAVGGKRSVGGSPSRVRSQIATPNSTKIRVIKKERSNTTATQSTALVTTSSDHEQTAGGGKRRVPPKRVMVERSIKHKTQELHQTKLNEEEYERLQQKEQTRKLDIKRIPSADVSLRRSAGLGKEHISSKAVMNDLHVPPLALDRTVEPVSWAPVQMPNAKGSNSSRLFMERLGLAAKQDTEDELKRKKVEKTLSLSYNDPSKMLKRVKPLGTPVPAPTLSSSKAQKLAMSTSTNNNNLSVDRSLSRLSHLSPIRAKQETQQSPAKGTTTKNLAASFSGTHSSLLGNTTGMDTTTTTTDDTLGSDSVEAKLAKQVAAHHGLAFEPTTISEEGLTSQTALNRFRALNQQQFELQQQQLHHYDGNRIVGEMKSSIHRVDRILEAFSKNRSYRDIAYYEGIGSDGTGGNTAVDEGAVEELRDIVQVLLREISKQTENCRKLELQEQMKDQLLKDARDELHRNQGKIQSLSTQCDQLIKEKEEAQRAITKLETELKQAKTHQQPSMMINTPTTGTFDDPDASVDEETLCLVPKEMAEAPAGDVTVVCTSIQGQAALWDKFPDEMQLAVSTHNRVMREVVHQHNGYQVKTCGEEFMVVFRDTITAVAFAHQLQRELVNQCWPQTLENHPDSMAMEFDGSFAGSPQSTGLGSNDDLIKSEYSVVPGRISANQLWAGLRVRVGIHCGEVLTEEDPRNGGKDYMGPTVNKALLLRKIAYGGMAAISKNVYTRLQEEFTRREAEENVFELPEEDDEGTEAMGAIDRLETEESMTYAKRKELALDELKRSRPDIRSSTTFHMALPIGKNQQNEEVYCMLPQDLEDRLDTIQLAMKAQAMSSGIDDVDNNAAMVAMDEGPSELESILGSYRTNNNDTAPVITADGVVEMKDLVHVTDGKKEVVESGLPSGDLALLCIRGEHCENPNFLQKLKSKESKAAIALFQTIISMALSPFGGQLVSQEADRHIIVFQSVESAVKCALHIDGDALDTTWSSVITNVESHPELCTVKWRNLKAFAGIRPCMGIQSGRLEPRYDPMTRQVGYMGHDAFMAARLCNIAKGGQLLIAERALADTLPKLQPLPIIMQMLLNPTFKKKTDADANAKKRQSVSSEAMDRRKSSSVAGAAPQKALEKVSQDDTPIVACVVIPKHQVGRLFLYNGMDSHQRWRHNARYRQLRDEVLRENLRWTKRATLVLPKNTTEKNTGDPNAHRRGQDVAASEAMLENTSLDHRRRDKAVAMSMAHHMSLRVLLNGTSDPIVTQLEAVEHNIMLLEDTFLSGQPVEYIPCLLDIADMRGLMGEQRGAGETGDQDLEAILALQQKQDEERRKHGADGSEYDDSDDDAMDKHGVAGRMSLAAKEEKRRQRLAAKEQVQAFTSMEEELSHTKEVRDQLNADILALHKMLRFFFGLVRSWMDPALDGGKSHSLTDDEVIQRLNSHNRTLQQEVAHRAPPAQRSSAEEWKRLNQQAMEKDAEDNLLEDGGKLCRSAVGHMCKYFVYLRTFMKRLKVKEAQRGGGGGGYATPMLHTRPPSASSSN